MSENIITWNAPNWITVTLMSAIGLAAAGSILMLIRNNASV